VPTTPGDSAPRRRAEISPLRRLSRNVLIIGTVVAVVAAWGPVWVVRAGVVVAVATAVVACVLAWRELAAVRHQHAVEMLAASRWHGAALREERRHNAAVVDTLTGRVEAATAERRGHQTHIVELTSTVVQLTATIGGLKSEISTLHGNFASAQGDIRQRESVIASLRETLRSREAELAALSDAGSRVRAIPRRMLTDREAASVTAADTEELWPDGRHPSVADLVDGPVLLPNYEGERKLA